MKVSLKRVDDREHVPPAAVRAAQRTLIAQAVAEAGARGLTRNEIARITSLRVSIVCWRVAELLEDGSLGTGPQRVDAVSGAEHNETLVLSSYGRREHGLERWTT